MSYLTELRLAISNLRAHKLRSFLTMLGMIFGVGAVIAMLSIGAGAEQESLRLIDTMGLRNIIVKDREMRLAARESRADVIVNRDQQSQGFAAKGVGN